MYCEACEGKDEPNNFHNSATALVLEAALRSGLLRKVPAAQMKEPAVAAHRLRDIAECLHFSSEHPACCNGPWCLACWMLVRLTDDFKEHCCNGPDNLEDDIDESISGIGYDFYGEGWCPPSVSDAEAARFCSVPVQVR